MENKIAVVTGANGAIGKAIARQLAELYDFEVVLACRNELKAEKATDEIKNLTGNKNLRYEIVDLSLKNSIQSLAERWKGPLHVLINNAAATPVTRQESSDGIEIQFATNVLGYLWMTEAFKDILKNSAPARVINVASYWAGDLDITDLEFKKRRYNNNTAYRQSKQADRMLTVAYASELKQYNITVNSCHPGDVNSKLSNDLGFGGHESPDQGAETPVWLATHATGGEKTGKFFAHNSEAQCVFSSNRRAIDDLYTVCRSYL